MVDVSGYCGIYCKVEKVLVGFGVCIFVVCIVFVWVLQGFCCHVCKTHGNTEDFSLL